MGLCIVFEDSDFDFYDAPNHAKLRVVHPIWKMADLFDTRADFLEYVIARSVPPGLDWLLVDSEDLPSRACRDCWKIADVRVVEDEDVKQRMMNLPMDYFQKRDFARRAARMRGEPETPARMETRRPVPERLRKMKERNLKRILENDFNRSGARNNDGNGTVVELEKLEE